jgi:SnoaL-like protein
VEKPEDDREAFRRGLVLRANERWNAGDREVNEEEIDPECEICSAMTGSVHRGYDGFRAWMNEIDEQFESWHARVVEFAPATNDRLLALGSVHLHGRGSGIELDVPVAWLYEFRGDRLLRMTTFPTYEEGRRAAAEA